LHRTSCACPGKRFTGNASIIETTAGILSERVHHELVQAVIGL
jgi:hypothetical protein